MATQRSGFWRFEYQRYRADRAQNLVQQKYENQDCALYSDFREVTSRPDIDAVVISTPDHWHTLPALEAARNGKDIYLEKPLTLTVNEGRVISDTVRKYSRVLQTGSMQRSMLLFRRACELVRNGYIGAIQKVEVSLPGNNRACPPPGSRSRRRKRWITSSGLGPAPHEPYTDQRCHYTFRFIRDYSGGQTTNWGAHYLDIAQWGLGMDDSGPVKIIGRGVFPKTGLFNTATSIDFDMIYDNGIKLTCRTGGRGTKFIGTEGSVFVNRSGW
ncbi:MAG: Gfo/Idh/MocA family oxidoreductase [candidate division KSB1 bacterium]|nr:Gfo/Idh/MocA family oxidoreductase [candidate division KSB1 bacterium]